MTIFTGIILFLMIWWTLLFCILPWGNAPPSELQVGHAASAPQRPRLGLKLAINTGVSVLIWIIFAFLILNDVLDLDVMGQAFINFVSPSV